MLPTLVILAMGVLGGWGIGWGYWGWPGIFLAFPAMFLGAGIVYLLERNVID